MIDCFLMITQAIAGMRLHYLLLVVALPPILLSWFFNFDKVAAFFLADLTAEAAFFFAEILDLVLLI